jgi:hypothetical protein
VGPDEAQSFYPQFGLAGPLLGQIWQEANAQKNEKLSKDEFFLSLRLVAQAQQGQAINAEAARATTVALIPKGCVCCLVFVFWFFFISFSCVAAAVSSPWVLVPQQQQMFDKVYLTVQEGGFVSGQKAKELFVSYGLPIPDLKIIWELSDADKDEQLSHSEFLVSMYLIYRVKQGDSVPETLPGKH